jgi:putative nucleotidyltransferase with HDIG domain
MVLLFRLGAASWLFLSRLVRRVLTGLRKAESDAAGARRLKRGPLVQSIARPLAAASGPARPAARRSPAHRRPVYTDVVVHRLALHARRVLGAERVCLLALNARESRRTNAVVIAEVARSSGRVSRALRRDGVLAGLALGSGRPAVAPRGGLPPPGSGPSAHGWDAAAPLPDAIGPRRVLMAGWGESDRAPGLAELELLCEFSSLAGLALRHQHEAKATGRPNIKPLLAALAARDGPTWRHSVEVANLATRVAKRLQLGYLDQREVHLAALLHDVGKMRLPEELLRRPGPLSPKEWELMRRHPEWGADTIAAIPGLEAVAMIVRLHHERPDGAGYPHQLTSERIPTASQIVSVCDAYCAMTSGRPNQAPRSPTDAMRELERHAGTQFDDQIVMTLRDAVSSPVAA